MLMTETLASARPPHNRVADRRVHRWNSDLANAAKKMRRRFAFVPFTQRRVLGELRG
jgi:hypothetical protein